MVNFELVPLIFLLIMVYVTYYAYKKSQISKKGVFIWMSLWSLGFLAVVFHPLINTFLNPLHLSRLFDLYTIIAFFVLMFIIFYLFRRQQIAEKNIETLTRALALKPLKEMKKEA
jgi:hypothetical protein